MGSTKRIYYESTTCRNKAQQDEFWARIHHYTYHYNIHTNNYRLHSLLFATNFLCSEKCDLLDNCFNMSLTSNETIEVFF